MKPVNVIGRRVGAWVALEMINSQTVRCRCDCGTIKAVAKASLLANQAGSCGCLRGTHGQSGDKAYAIWSTMHARCSNPNSEKYPWYGGRGITVCERWMKFENFIADMGNPPPGMTIDRKRTAGNYEPDNCRWATWKQQRRNRSDVKLEPHEPDQIRWLFGEGYGAKEISKFFEINVATAYKIKNGTIYAPEGSP